MSIRQPDDMDDIPQQPDDMDDIPQPARLPTEFKKFPKIARLSRNCTITEKIDGTNASIFISEDGAEFLIGSRTRWITPETDNHGFARWATEHKAELLGLGAGHHFGEWWGLGIQRAYGQKEKRFSLFNTSRWNAENPPPACCSVVPVLFSGIFSSTAVDDALDTLRKGGSWAAPGFMQPEGVVIYQTAGRCYFKKTLLKDDEPKSLQKKE